MKAISILFPILFASIAMTLMFANPQGIGNYKIAVHRILVGVCHWNGAGSAGVTWMTDPWFFVGGIYDDGESLGEPSTCNVCYFGGSSTRNHPWSIGIDVPQSNWGTAWVAIPYWGYLMFWLATSCAIFWIRKPTFGLKYLLLLMFVIGVAISAIPTMPMPFVLALIAATHLTIAFSVVSLGRFVVTYVNTLRRP